jgi:Ca-activated chloride channel family protein
MTFTQPVFLLGLLGVLLFACLYALAQRRRRKFAMRFTNLALLRSVVGSGPRVRRHIPPAALLLGAAGLVVGMAQPVLNLEVARNDTNVMLVIDTSGSMAATDVAPTRMDAARTAASKLINQLPASARIGLITFNSYATVAAPLTDKRSTIQDALDQLRAKGGTAIGDALALAVSELTATPDKAASSTSATKSPSMIVLLTDGASNRGINAMEAATQAGAAHIPVQTIGIGSRDAGVTVGNQPVGGVDEQALSAIASATGGKYYFAEQAGTLSQIYATLGSQFGWRPVKVDMTVPMMILGTAFVVAAATASLVWFRVLP